MPWSLGRYGRRWCHWRSRWLRHCHILRHIGSLRVQKPQTSALQNGERHVGRRRWFQRIQPLLNPATKTSRRRLAADFAAFNVRSPSLSSPRPVAGEAGCPGPIPRYCRSVPHGGTNWDANSSTIPSLSTSRAEASTSRVGASTVELAESPNTFGAVLGGVVGEDFPSWV